MPQLLPPTQPPKSVCILRLSAIGDCCHTLPVIRSLQAAWPDTQFCWIIGQIEAQLMQDVDGIELLVFNKNAGKADVKAFTRELAGRQFDLLLHMQASLRSSLLTRHIRAPIKLGFDKPRAKDYQWLFSNHRIAANPNQHVIEGLFGFAEACGVTERLWRWDIPLSQSDQEFAEQHIPQPQQALIISPCSSQRARNFRNWPAERYAQLADFAEQQFGLKTILSGGPSALEQDYGKAITAHCNVAQPVNLIGKTSLKQLLALIQRSLTVVAPDSGPIHMATAVNTPAIALFASSNPLRTGPARDQRWIVNEYPAAAGAEFGQPLEKIAWGKRVRNPEVMLRIETSAVTARLEALIAHLAKPQ